MPKVSVIIPTHNRPDLIGKAIQSVLNQTFQDFEIIVVDDGLKQRAETEVKKFKDERIRYIQHETNRGGAAARNTGIKVAQGEYIAFLDDDDEWLPKKTDVQMTEFEKTSKEVGFCFCAAECIYNDKRTQNTTVPQGINDYYEQILKRFNGFLTVTLIIKIHVFREVGFFDVRFPSHQEPELMIRISKKYKGLGINKSLVIVNMRNDHDHIGNNLSKRAIGRKLILEKYINEFNKRPAILAKHYFQLALYYRDNGEYKNAGAYFLKAWLKNLVKIRYLVHYILMLIK